MQPVDPTLEIMRRTMRNLEFIERHRDLERGPYEVTQLVNSFLGALAHPWERQFDKRLRGWPLDEARKQGWPIPHCQSGNKPRTLGYLLRLVRNAFAHGNLEFHGPLGGEIREIEIWNIDPDTGAETWRGRFDVGDLRQFLLCFVRLAEEQYEREVRGGGRRPR